MATNLLRKVCGVIRQHSRWPSQKTLDVIYGPQAKQLRASVATILHGHNIAPSAKEAQYGRLRAALMSAAGIERSCIAVEDAYFETTAHFIAEAKVMAADDSPDVREF